MKDAANFFIVAISIILALIYGQTLLVPFTLGLLFWFMMHSLKNRLEKFRIFKKQLPSWSTTLLSSGIIFALLAGLFEILSNNIADLTQSYPKYEPNVDSVIASINQQFDLNIVETVQKQIGDFDFGALLGSVFSSLSEMISSTFMIMLYALFILLEESNFKPKLKAMFESSSNYDDFMVILEKMEGSIAEYFKLKALVSLATGFLSYIVLRIIGVDAPEFWAFLIFILNFIPTIGSLVGTIFPAVFALLQFGELNPFIMVLVFVGIIQILVGNILEPRLMGSTMNISPLVTILALSIWGALWGVIGMILSVPITVTMIIIFSHFEKTRPIAILLSEKGKVGTSRVIRNYK